MRKLIIWSLTIFFISLAKRGMRFIWRYFVLVEFCGVEQWLRISTDCNIPRLTWGWWTCLTTGVLFWICRSGISRGTHEQERQVGLTTVMASHTSCVLNKMEESVLSVSLERVRKLLVIAFVKVGQEYQSKASEISLQLSSCWLSYMM